MRSLKDNYSRLKDFDVAYKNKGSYHFFLKGFAKWWTYDQYKMLARHVGSEDRIMDLAGGDGKLSNFLKTSSVINVDHSFEGLKFARSKTGRHCTQAKMQDLPFQPDSFDSIVCSLSLQYLFPAELDKCFKDVRSILKKNGKFVFSYPKKNEDDITHVALQYDSLFDHLEKAGFRVVFSRGVFLRIPRLFVRLSQIPIINLISFVIYKISRIGYFFPKQSFHYILACENKKFNE